MASSLFLKFLARPASDPAEPSSSSVGDRVDRTVLWLVLAIGAAAFFVAGKALVRPPSDAEGAS